MLNTKFDGEVRHYLRGKEESARPFLPFHIDYGFLPFSRILLKTYETRV